MCVGDDARHTVVCRAAQKNGLSADGVGILTGTVKSRFSCVRSSVMSYPNSNMFTVELAGEAIQCIPHLNKIPQVIPEI